MSNMLNSLQAKCTSTITNMTMPTTNRLFTNLKNHPFTIINLMYITLLILTFSIPYALGKEKHVSNFVYEPVRDDLIIGARYLYSGTRWVPCDLLGAKETMSDLSPTLAVAGRKWGNQKPYHLGGSGVDCCRMASTVSAVSAFKAVSAVSCRLFQPCQLCTVRSCCG